MQSQAQRKGSGSCNMRLFLNIIFGVLAVCSLSILYYTTRVSPTPQRRGLTGGKSSQAAGDPQPRATAQEPASPAAAACPPASPAAAAAAAGVHGLARIMSEGEIDDVFRVRSELDGSFGTADAEMLLPYFQIIYGHARGQARAAGSPDSVGGFVDVGANVGAVTAAILGRFSNHDLAAYHHALGAGQPPLTDALHPIYNSEKLVFALAVEASPATLTLLQRRAEYFVWSAANAKVVHAAAANSSGTMPFCYAAAGSEQSGIASTAGAPSAETQRSLQATDGKLTCADVRSAKLADLVDEEAGPDARIFLLKIDAEGADGIVLAGAWRLFQQRRVRYVVFECHSKWLDFPAVAGYTPRSVGEWVTDLHGLGYACYFVHPMGLFPFPAAGTPEGQRLFKDQADVSRHKLYNRHFWSNVACGPADDHWLNVWLPDAMLVNTKEELQKRP